MRPLMPSPTRPLTRHRLPRVRGRLAAVLLAATALGAAVTVAPTSAAATCATAWGSTTKTTGTVWMSHVTNVRAGQQACYDRLVIDLDGAAVGYHVSYVDQVSEPGRGEIVPLRGGAKLQVIAYAPTYDDDGRPTYRAANPDEVVNVSGYRTFRQVAYAGSFEGETTLGLGVRARLPFRVFTLESGTTSRIVVDVAHQW